MDRKPTYEELEDRIGRLERRVHELKCTEGALRESAERLDLAFASARVGRWDWDVRSGQVVYNERWAKMLGYGGPAMEPRTGDWESLIHPDDRQRVFRTLREHQEGPSPEYQAEYRLRTGSGEWHWILSRGKVVETDDRGRTLRMVGVHVDIDDRKRAEEALRESEEKYKAMAETAPDAVVTTDLVGNITYASASCATLFGYERREELLGKSGFELMARAEHENAAKGIDTTLRQGTNRDERYRLLRRDGTAFVGEVSAAVVPDGQGEPKGFVVIVKDITERNKAEAALQASEAQFRTLAEASLAGIFIVQGSKFRYVNPAAARMFGYEGDDIVERMGLLALAHPGDRTALEMYIEECLTGRADTTPFSFRSFRRDGLAMECEVLGRAIHFEGSPAVIGTLLDVSERKRAEQEIFRAQKLESVGLLAGGVAHDFNNIIMAIWGNIDLAKMEIEADRRELIYLEEAERACRRAQALSQQLITFSKGGAPVKKPTAVARVVREAADLSLSGSSVRCEVSLGSGLWSAWADEGQIVQVFSNLFLNATQAMPEGGVVYVSAENRVVREWVESGPRPGSYIEISVEDHGIGVKQENLQRIFDPYFTTKQKGSGLGLAVVYSIVTRHGGHISVESEAGVRTRFEIHLPACEAGAEEAEAVRDEIVTGRGKILVMEDDEGVRRVVDGFLRSLGYDVELAADGAEAVRLFQDASESGRAFDVVILDLTVPGGIGGKEAVRRLLEIEPQVKAIVSSGYSDDPVLADFERYGFVAAIRKPYEVRGLSKVLKRVVSKT